MNRDELKDTIRLKQCLLEAELHTCKRRKVGCIMVDREYHILAAGYNGTSTGAINCNETPCKGAGYPSGQGLEFCEAIHAEQNALIQLATPAAVWTIYCTTAPCLHCVKMLKNTGAKRLIFAVDYPHSDMSKEEWMKPNKKTGEVREWIHLPHVTI